MMIAEPDDSSRGADMRKLNLTAFRSKQIKNFQVLQGD